MFSPQPVTVKAERYGGPVQNDAHETLPARATPQAVDHGILPMTEVVTRVRRIQEVMQALMKDGTHYGTIPGTPKPTLYQPGAELLCSTFRIAPAPLVDDLSTQDTVRYRVRMQATNQVTGEILGEGVGECSSDEEKYRWRKPVCDEEFAETPEDRRREKWMHGKSGTFKAKQIRTSPTDIANTVLKMAYKRALISMTRVVLACSDIFAQDLEDLPAEVRDSVIEGELQQQAAQRKEPQPKAKPNGGSKPADAGLVTAPLAVYDVQARKDKNDKAYWVLTLSDNTRYSTREQQTALELESFKGTKSTVRVRYTVNKVGDREYRDLVSFAVDEAPAASGKPAELLADDIAF